MSTEPYIPELTAGVLIHTYGTKPNKEVKAKIMDFIEANEEETMKLTAESFPSPEEELRLVQAKIAMSLEKHQSPRSKQQRRSRPRNDNPRGRGGNSSGRASPGY